MTYEKQPEAEEGRMKASRPEEETLDEHRAETEHLESSPLFCAIKPVVSDDRCK